MSVKEKQKKIPELRFPGFAGEWEEKRLGDIAKITTGSSNRENSLELGKYKFFDRSVDSRWSDKYLFDDEVLIVAGEGLEFFPRYYKGKFDLHQRAYAVMKSKSKASWKYLYYYIIFHRLWFNRMAVGSTMPSLRMDAFIKMPIKLPKNEEQQKIAAFLSAADAWIENLKSQKEALDEYERGLMQKLFPAKGESLPDLRFGEFSGEWEGKKLGDIAERYNGLKSKTKKDFGSGSAYITYTQIFENSKIKIENFGKVKVGENENQNKAKYGDVFFTTSSETPLEVGMSSVLLDRKFHPYLNSFAFGIRPKSFEILNPEFAQFYFRADVFRNKMYKLAQGSTRFNISRVEFMIKSILLPCSDEQKKIADFLSSVDTMIKSREAEITAAKKWKRGLMQQMFV